MCPPDVHDDPASSAKDEPKDGPKDDASSGRDGNARRDGLVPDGEWVREQRAAFRYVGVGIQFGFVLVLSALAGAWLDGRFGTSPLLLVVGVFVGFAGAAYALIKKFTPS